MTVSAYLVATHAGLFHVRVDEHLELLECIRLRSGHHYAISVRAADNRVYSKNRDESLNILALDTLEKIGEVSFEPVPAHVHQAVVIDQGVLLTDTLHNRITFQPIAGAAIHYVIDGHTNDVNHVNSLFVRAGGVVAVLHNMGNGDSELLDLDFDPAQGFTMVQRRALAATGCHNVFVDGQLLLFNASDAGDFVACDLGSGCEVLRTHFDGHTKGLSVTDDHVVIGLSEVAQQAQRGRCASALVFFNRETNAVVGRIELRDSSTGDTIGNVNEIRCLSTHDFSEGDYVDGLASLPSLTTVQPVTWTGLLRARLRALVAQRAGSRQRR